MHNRDLKLIGFYAVSLTALCIATLAYLSLGAIPVERFGHDIVYMLDWAWRVHNGQIPHNDFPVMLGGGFVYLCTAFLKLTHYDLYAFSLMNACMTAACFVSCVILLGKNSARLSLSFSFFRNASVLVLILSLILAFGYGCYHLGVQHSTTYANLYNRYGFMLLTLVLTECFIVKERGKYFAPVVCGIALFAMISIKYTYFFIGLLFLALSFLIDRNIRRLLSILAVCAFLLLLYFILTGIDPVSMLADYQRVAKIRSGSTLFDPEFLVEKFGTNLVWGPLWLAFAPVCYFFWEKMWIEGLLIISIVGSAILLHLTNYGFTDIPLMSLASVVILDKLPVKKIGSGLIILLFCVFAVLFLRENSLGLTRATKFSRQKEHLPVVDSAVVKNFYVINADGKGNEHYPEKLKEGELLIKSYIDKPERIATLSYENPFNFLLQSTPPKYLPTIWQFGMTFDKNHFPDYSKIFSDVNIIMIPKVGGWESTLPLLEIYGADINRDFKKIGESPRWILMQRMAAP